MRIAIIGAHGTGKTTIINLLRKEFPQFVFYDDLFRDITIKTGYIRPRDIVKESGISPLVSAALNGYHGIEEKNDAILDQAPVTILAYYFIHADKAEKNIFIKKLARYYSDLIDFYIYFPIGKISVISDGMRPVELQFQKEVDDSIRLSINCLSIDKRKVYELKSVGVFERLNEVKEIIGGLRNDK